MNKSILPKGEALRRAVRWLGQQRRDRPEKDIVTLIAEASTRFDLSPLDEQFLLDHLRQAPEERAESPQAK